MSLRLLGSERRRLREILLAAFDRAGLVRALGEASPARDFEHLVGSGAFADQVFELIRCAEKEGWLEELEVLLQRERPRSKAELTAIFAGARSRAAAGRRSLRRGARRFLSLGWRVAASATLIVGVAVGGWVLWRSWQDRRADHEQRDDVGEVVEGRDGASPQPSSPGFEISPNRVRLTPGEGISLVVGWRDDKRSLNPAKGESWTSEKPEIAEVDADGHVVAIGPGGTSVIAVARSPHGLGTATGSIDVGPLIDFEDSNQSDGLRFSIVGINDTSRIEGLDGERTGGLARVRGLRTRLERQGEEVLLLHAGDFLYPSLLSQVYQGAQMVDVMNLLDGSSGFDDRMFVTFGRHEFDRSMNRDALELDRRIEEAEFFWLGSNIEFASNSDESLIDAANLLKSALIDVGGVQVGLFSLTSNLRHPQYVLQFEEPVEAAERFSFDLRRRGAEVVVALSHLRLAEDVSILERLGDSGPDLIIGGHEHEAQARLVNGRWVRKADAEAASATVVRVRERRDGTWAFAPELVPLEGSDPSPDPIVQQRVNGWITRLDAHYCRQILNLAPGCLDEVFGFTQTALIGDQSIRSVETSLGNFVADEMRRTFASQGAQVAFINSGALRLNQNLPPRSAVTRRHLVELFPYPAGLRLLRIDGRTLSEVASHSVEGWPGAGHWLQVSGFAFRFDPRSGRVSDLTLLAPDGPRPVHPEDEILAVTNYFLAYGNDGYSMLDPGLIVPGSQEEELESVIREALRSAGPQGITPKPEGRTCNTTLPSPCLAERGLGGG